MPVYLLTIHAYRSWREDHDRGYVQHGQGRKPSNASLARWRDRAANHEPVEFDQTQQVALHDTVAATAAQTQVRLHGVATCPTHAHVLVSFHAPACECGTARHCGRGCPARREAERIATRMKQMSGRRLGIDANVGVRPWFSRGWDITPVRGRQHFDYLMRTYLPDHEQSQNGVFRTHEKQ